MSLTPEDAWLLENTYEDMVHAGAMLTDAQKDEVKAINTRLSELTTQFSQSADRGDQRQRAGGGRPRRARRA